MKWRTSTTSVRENNDSSKTLSPLRHTAMNGRWRYLLFGLIGLLCVTYCQQAQAAHSIKMLGGKLVIYGSPKGEVKGGKAHIWWDYSWYFRVAGEKVAKGKGRVFDVTVSRKGGTFKKKYGKKGLTLTVKGEVEGNEVHVEITGKFEYKGQSEKLGSFQLSGKIGK